MARWFEEAWFWIKAVSVGEGAVVVYARATTPFEVVTVSIASLIFARLALLEVGYELMGEILTTQIQYLVSTALGHSGAKEDYIQANDKFPKGATRGVYHVIPMWLIQLLTIWGLGKTFLDWLTAS